MILKASDGTFEIKWIVSAVVWNNFMLKLSNSENHEQLKDTPKLSTLL